MIQAVIFDVGGVLVRTEDRAPRLALEQRLGLQPGEAEQIVFNSEMGTRAQMGSITSAQLWTWVQESLDLDAGGLREFREEFYAGDRLDVTLVDYIRRLRPAYQTAIISNAADNLVSVLADDYEIAGYFDLIVGSAYEKVMKPAPAIYERTLVRLGRAPSETVFVDDFAHNVEGARALGMHAVHFRNGMDLPGALAELGDFSRDLRSGSSVT